MASVPFGPSGRGLYFSFPPPPGLALEQNGQFCSRESQVSGCLSVSGSAAESVLPPSNRDGLRYGQEDRLISDLIAGSSTFHASDESSCLVAILDVMDIPP